jgi:hypothetical protein
MIFGRDVVRFSCVVRASDFQRQIHSSPEPKFLNFYGAQESIPRYDNPIPTRFFALIDCLKIPALGSIPAYFDTVESEGRQIKVC